MKIQVHKPFSLTMETGEVTDFAVGIHDVSNDVGEHWFTRAHSNVLSAESDTPGNSQIIDDLQEQVAGAHLHLAEKDNQIASLENNIAEKNQQIIDLNTLIESNDLDIATLLNQIEEMKGQISKSDDKSEETNDGKKSGTSDGRTSKK